MKKIVSWLLVVMIICCQFSVMTAFAADTTVTTDVPASSTPDRAMTGDQVTLSLSPAQSTLKAGDEFTVNVNVSANHYMINGNIHLSFDPALLELVEINADDVDYAYVESVNEDIIVAPTWAFRQVEAGECGFVFATAATGTATAGTVFSLSFKVLDGWNGKTAIELTSEEMASCAVAGGVEYSTNLVLKNAFVTVEDEAAVKTGVNKIGDDYYYVNADGSYKTGKFWVTANGANGLVTAGYVYADETGRFYNNEFYTIDGALYFMEIGQPTTNTGVREINGDLYSLNYKGKVNIGEIWVTAAGSNGLVTEGYCYTDETGRFYNNEFALINGTYCYMEKGRPVKGEGGVREVNGDLYYVSWKGNILTGTVYVSNPNGYTVKGNHYTDETGRFYNNEFVTIDGTLYYMVKGRPMQNGGGVEEINGNLYYITWKGIVLTGEIYVTNPNGYTVKGRHYTDETGRFYDEELVTLADGNNYYIVNGRIYNTPGVLEVNGDLYYVTWEGPIATGEVYVTYTNGLIETTGWHYTDEQGRFLDGEFTTASDGKTYYIVKGAKYTTGGVLEVDGNYYYVSWNSSIVVNGPVNITATNNNGHNVPTGKYTTDANGVIQF